LGFHIIDSGIGPHLGYLAVFAGTFLEGETILVLGGLAAQHGYLSFWGVVGVAVIGAFLGDQVFYFIGRRYGRRLLARFPALGGKAARVHALLERWDILAIVLVRFAYGLRFAGAIVIGSSGIAPWRLALFGFVGALIWAPLVTGVGYFVGQAVQAWLGRLHPAHVLLAMAVLVTAGMAWIAIRWRRR
jgi:membrane protein DedA with SNARE-associated domain